MEIPDVILSDLLEDTILPIESEFRKDVAAGQATCPAKKSIPLKTPREHLKAARKALADGYKPNKDPMKTNWGKVRDAQRYLSTITANDSECAEARALMEEVNFRLEEMDKVATIITKRIMIKQREMFTDEFEFYFLAKGIDAHILLNGADKSYLKIECTPFSEVSILKMVHETDFLVYLERAGFKRVVLTDGEAFSWAYNFRT